MTDATTTSTGDSGSSFWDDIAGGAGDAWDWLTGGSSGANTAIGLGGAGIAQMLGLLDSPQQKPSGYQGSIPDLTYNRSLIQHPDPDPNRRPGAAGRQYFTQGTFSGGSPMPGYGLPPSGGAAGSQLAQGDTPPPNNDPTIGNGDNTHEYAEGGLATLMGDKKEKPSQYLRGDTDGMADEVEAIIGGEEPAALSDGEFVIPADVVSHLGNGNSEAGAKVLEQMMSRIRKERTGNEEQGSEINPENFMPM